MSLIAMSEICNVSIYQCHRLQCMRSTSDRPVFCSLFSCSVTQLGVCQAPLCVGFSRKECWCGLPFPPPGDLPDQPSDPHLLCLLCLLHCRWVLYHWATGEAQINLRMREYAAAAAAKSLQSYPTLCDPIDGSPPGSSIPGVLQARTLEWVAISFSNMREYMWVQMKQDWLWIDGWFFVNRRRQWHPTPVLLPGKSHGRRSLVGWYVRTYRIVLRIFFDCLKLSTVKRKERGRDREKQKLKF